jgi:hypothetical protein
MVEEGHSEYTHGSMDISAHMKSYLGFWKAVKWSSLTLILIAILLALFRTHN